MPAPLLPLGSSPTQARYIPPTYCNSPREAWYTHSSLFRRLWHGRAACRHIHPIGAMSWCTRAAARSQSPLSCISSLQLLRRGTCSRRASPKRRLCSFQGLEAAPCSRDRMRRSYAKMLEKCKCEYTVITICAVCTRVWGASEMMELELIARARGRVRRLLARTA